MTHDVDGLALRKPLLQCELLSIWYAYTCIIFIRKLCTLVESVTYMLFTPSGIICSNHDSFNYIFAFIIRRSTDIFISCFFPHVFIVLYVISYIVT